MIKDVEALIAARKLLEEGLVPILEQLKNVELPLKERWDAYTLLVKNNILVKNESYGDGHIASDMTQYDDFYNDRGATVKYVDMYEHIMEADGDYQERLVRFREGPELIEWQEKVLAEGYSSFTYDW